jgi:hypothetical protein
MLKRTLGDVDVFIRKALREVKREGGDPTVEQMARASVFLAWEAVRKDNAEASVEWRRAWGILQVALNRVTRLNFSPKVDPRPGEIPALLGGIAILANRAAEAFQRWEASTHAAEAVRFAREATIDALCMCGGMKR